MMTHPGVGPLTALAFELVIGTPERFHCGKQIASYVGLVPTEESSGNRRERRHRFEGSGWIVWIVGGVVAFARKVQPIARGRRINERRVFDFVVVRITEPHDVVSQR